MKYPTIIKERVNLNLTDEVALFVLRIGIVACGAIGVFAVSCLVFTLINQGPLAMIRGYAAAVVGF